MREVIASTMSAEPPPLAVMSMTKFFTSGSAAAFFSASRKMTMSSFGAFSTVGIGPVPA